jgi:DNA-binding transcriptional regulator YdaS (Cro superfamily)
MKAIDKAIQAAGGQSALARLIGVRQSHIWNWANRDRQGVPPNHVLSIEKVTGVSRHELRPDIFPASSQVVPPATGSFSPPTKGGIF